MKQTTLAVILVTTAIGCASAPQWPLPKTEIKETLTHGYHGSKGVYDFVVREYNTSKPFDNDGELFRIVEFFPKNTTPKNVTPYAFFGFDEGMNGKYEKLIIKYFSNDYAPAKDEAIGCIVGQEIPNYEPCSKTQVKNATEQLNSVLEEE